MQAHAGTYRIGVASCDAVYPDEYILDAFRQGDGPSGSGVSFCQADKVIKCGILAVCAKDLIIIVLPVRWYCDIDDIVFVIVQCPHAAVSQSDGQLVIAEDQGIFLVFSDRTHSGRIAAGFGMGAGLVSGKGSIDGFRRFGRGCTRQFFLLCRKGFHTERICHFAKKGSKSGKDLIRNGACLFFRFRSFRFCRFRCPAGCFCCFILLFFLVFFRIFFLDFLCTCSFIFRRSFCCRLLRCIVFLYFLRFLASRGLRYVRFFCVRSAGGLTWEKFLEGSIPVCDRKKVGRVQFPVGLSGQSLIL